MKQEIQRGAQAWYENWFDTPFYHILYAHRDWNEASNFIGALLHYLKPKPQAKAMDLACGKGRHAIQLNQAGLEVIGADLSTESISAAKEFENETLRFIEHDMREVYRENEFDYIFNLFTSFGYFENDADNLGVFLAANKMLKRNGLLIFDFFNEKKVSEEISKFEIIERDNIEFHIKKNNENGVFIKDIQFEHLGSSYHFQEKVKAYNFQDFKTMLSKANFEIEHTFGNYDLNDFDENTSERLIIIARKTTL